ncbi:MAG TPA: hypothetical protein VEA59_00730 [Patescibacteria group bacterium]|nr:hypothetical protein [Patescibacteria group bacterium]
MNHRINVAEAFLDSMFVPEAVLPSQVRMALMLKQILMKAWEAGELVKLHVQMCVRTAPDCFEIRNAAALGLANYYSGSWRPDPKTFPYIGVGDEAWVILYQLKRNGRLLRDMVRVYGVSPL